MSQLCPAVERCINEKYLPRDFVMKVEREMKNQKRRGSGIKIDLNKLYSYTNLNHNAYLYYRNVCMNKANIVRGIEYNNHNDKRFIEKIDSEYLYQKQQIKNKKQTSIKIDINTVYYS